MTPRRQNDLIVRIWYGMKATHGASPADEAKDMTIQFRTNARKALEVILWFAQRGRTDFHGILKLLFFADKHHLNAYGRPIVGDQYKALPYGRVAQTTYITCRRTTNQAP